MIERKVIIDKVVNFTNIKLSELSANSPLFMILVKPIATRIIDNNISKLDSMLKLIQDKDGKVDIEGLIDEISNNLLVATINEYSDILGGIKIGNGTISINIPGINKSIVLDSSDIDNFKNSLISK